MCHYDASDGDRCDVYEITHPRSRVDRRCIVCSTTIAKGEQYERHSMVFEGTADSECMCAPCALAHRAFREDEHHHGYPNPGNFEENLRECFHGALKGDPEAKIWRDHYAGILRRDRRRRVAERLEWKRRRAALIAAAQAEVRP